MATGQEFINIKQKVKAEMNRRNLNNSSTNYNSLAAYGGTSFDFSNAPVAGEVINSEIGEKTINLLYQVEDLENVEFVQQNNKLPSDTAVSGLSTYVDNLASESMLGDTSSCRGACSGLCAGSCIGGCNGCSGACNTGCMGCTATCGTGCASGAMA